MALMHSQTGGNTRPSHWGSLGAGQPSQSVSTPEISALALWTLVLVFLSPKTPGSEEILETRSSISGKPSYEKELGCLSLPC